VLKGSGSESVITNWVDARTRLKWIFDAEPGKYRVEALVWSAEEGGVTVRLGDQKIETELPDTGEDYELVELGELEIKENGEQAISLLPAAGNNSDKQLMYLELIKL
jgi:alpha-L-fucosidase